MTRNSAAVATLDDRRRCPISAASNVVDDAQSMTNGIATSGSSSSGDAGGGDEGSSPKSSSALSTTTSCCGGCSSSSSRSGSDDDDSAAVVRPSADIDRGCPAAASTSPLSSLQKEVEVGNNGDRDSLSSNNSDRGDDATTTTTGNSTNIGGRLTFYKDGQFIFQLAAHRQEQSCDSQSATTSSCRWVPVPTVIQQHKNNVKSIGEWPQQQQNKTIWPYLVTSPVSESKSPQPIQQSQPPVVRKGEWKQQQYQHRTTPPPVTPVGSAVNVASCTTSVVMATTTNIVRRPSRKCSTTTVAENTTDFQSQNWQLQYQSRTLSKRSQPYQHQSFIMIATKAIKAQRHLLSLPGKQRRRFRKRRTAISRESLLSEQQPPSVNLECVVRNLWCRRHTTELLLRRQLSLNNNVDTIAITAVDTASVSQHIVTTAGSVDSSCLNTGNGKRRSIFSPLPTTTLTIPTTATAIITNNVGISGSSSPNKKYKLGQQPPQILQQQRSVVMDKNIKKKIPQSLLLPQVVSNNDHSITAILSGNAVGTKRSCGSGVATTVVATDSRSNSTSTTTTTTTSSTVVLPQKISPLSSPAPLSLLRTLLKSPSREIGSSSIVGSTNGGYKHPNCGSRKRSAIESSTVPPILPSNITAAAVATTIDNGLRSTVMVSPSSADTSTVNDAAAAALTALHQLPTLHHPSSVTAAGQLAAAGYFNVLYHQAAMAAAMAYQTHTQLPHQLPKSQPASPLLFSQFPPTGGVNHSWQRQVNRRLPILPITETVGGSGVTVTTSASTIVAPYSSPLVAVTVNGSGLLPPATPSPPPSLPLHPHPVHHLLLHRQQPYQPVPKVQKPPSSYYQHKRQQGISVKQRTVMTAMDSAEYGDRMDRKNVSVADVESSSSTDCVPLNLSKDCVAENVGDTSTTATVR